MPPKNKFSEADILEAAFNVVRKAGWKNCTARSIASELGSSTMPIYSYVSSMADLKAKILQKATDLLIDYQTRVKTDAVFLDMGVGYVLFARDEKNLFRLMFKDIVDDLNDNAEDNRQHGMFAVFQTYAFDTLLDRLSDSTLLTDFSKEKKEKILYHAWIFSHGLAVLINNSVIPNMNEEDIIALLREFGKSIIEGSRILNHETPGLVNTNA